MALFAFWTAIKGLMRTALGWIFASPARLLLILAVTLGLIAMVEHRSAAKWEAQAIKVARTLTDERAAAQAAKVKAEQHYQEIAHDADQNHAALQAQGDARLADYIAAHRLRPSAPHPASAAQDHGPAILADPAPSPIMAALTISEADLRICDANYTYAKAAHDWAGALNTAP